MVDKFYKCNFDNDGLCKPRIAERDFRVEDDRVTLWVNNDQPINAFSNMAYAKSTDQKIKLLLKVKADHRPRREDEVPRRVYGAWPGQYSQDLFLITTDLYDHMLARLGWVDPATRRRELEDELKRLERSQESAREAARNNRRKEGELGRQIVSLRHELRGLTVTPTFTDLPDDWYDDYNR
jgi:hypothetical protein